jgi:hypothetical protein
VATTASTRAHDKNSVKPTGGAGDAQTTHSDAVRELIAQHLRDVTALPNAAVSHFTEELAKTPTARKRTRK